MNCALKLDRTHRFRVGYAARLIHWWRLTLHPGAKGREKRRLFREIEADLDRDRLPEETVQALTRDADDNYEQFLESPPRNMRLDRPEDIKKYRARVAVEAVRDILEQDPGVRSVANLGCGTDVVSACLSGLFPSVEFLSVDFPTLIKPFHHALFQARDNWRFQPGYALDLLENKTIEPGLAVLSAVTCLLPTGEYARLLRALPQSCSYVVISDLWAPPVAGLPWNPWRIPLPNDVPPGKPWNQACWCNMRYQHNHIAALEQAGFDPLSCDILNGNLRPQDEMSENILTIRLTARRKTAS